jgi:hypothetical protein
MNNNSKQTSETGERGRVLKFAEICAFARTAESTMRTLIREGKGPPIFTLPGRKRRIAFENDVHAWLTAMRQAPPAA